MDRTNRFASSSVVFLRLLAITHLIAFASAWPQVAGLIGPHGIAPASHYLSAVHKELGASSYASLPTLCWIFGTAKFLSVLCVGGIAVSVLLFAGIAPPVCLVLLWLCYLSLDAAGQMFFAFQWDALLLEVTLAAVFVAPWKWLPLWRRHEPPRLARILVWWILFRLMFFAGVVKLASGDPAWRNLTALTYHYETQPLPTPLAWYAFQLPAWWHRAECLAMFVIELGAPWLIWAPRRWRHPASLVLAAFMALIAATGNYTFFNLLAIVLCLFCLDDAFGQRIARLPWRHEPRAQTRPAVERADETGAAPAAGPDLRTWTLRAFAAFTLAYTGIGSLLVLFPGLGAPPGYAAVAKYAEPLRSFNQYGLFAVMTHPRYELVFEGSNDGRTWHEYEFPFKPGDTRDGPKFVAPFQPRLDWQLWFAAMEPPGESPWVLSFCAHLLEGTPEVLSLLARDPFPARPPRFIRVVRYEYHFTDRAIRARTGQWWRREPVDVYLEPLRLDPAGRLSDVEYTAP